MRNMRRPVVIAAPFATPEETARTYGIPKRRANELRKMVEDSLLKKGFIFEGRKILWRPGMAPATVHRLLAV